HPAGSKKAVPVFLHPAADGRFTEVVAGLLTFNPLECIGLATALGNKGHFHGEVPQHRGSGIISALLQSAAGPAGRIRAQQGMRYSSFFRGRGSTQFVHSSSFRGECNDEWSNDEISSKFPSSFVIRLSRKVACEPDLVAVLGDEAGQRFGGAPFRHAVGLGDVGGGL